MTTLTRIIVISIISIVMLSCNIMSGIDGNGNVIDADRIISNTFEEVKVSQGIDLYITQANDVALTIEADENLHDLIRTEVENGVLKIYSTKNIRRASSKKVLLNIKTISAIKATSGSDVFGTNTIKVSNLELNSTSGADITLDVETDTLNCHSTSGSDIELSGSTITLIAEATSGSDIDASKLKAETSNVKVTSGADISVNTSKALTANATSGGDIKYYGNPEKVNKSDNSAGSIKQQ
ncbi:head GIN domain-containing protein [Winogradskyella helgolandensis]|uniref:head GIN domain-containing protein n=1 Tax=Winogradskyella helgolandensis TaxID=2697010 RepID=UPI0015B897EF|nr:head GIN domain-containing protein [Winogradskyella helgolandensis]